jgi:hypothetical protein
MARLAIQHGQAVSIRLQDSSPPAARWRVIPEDLRADLELVASEDGRSCCVFPVAGAIGTYSIWAFTEAGQVITETIVQVEIGENRRSAPGSGSTSIALKQRRLLRRLR